MILGSILETKIWKNISRCCRSFHDCSFVVIIYCREHKGKLWSVIVWRFRREVSIPSATYCSTVATICRLEFYRNSWNLTMLMLQSFKTLVLSVVDVIMLHKFTTSRQVFASSSLQCIRFLNVSFFTFAILNKDLIFNSIMTAVHRKENI